MTHIKDTFQNSRSDRDRVSSPHLILQPPDRTTRDPRKRQQTGGEAEASLMKCTTYRVGKGSVEAGG